MWGNIYKCEATFINVGQRHHRWARKEKEKVIKEEGREGDRERETVLRLHPDQ